MKTILAFLFSGLIGILPLSAELIIHDVMNLVTPPIFDPHGETQPNEFSTVGVFLQFSTGLAFINHDETTFPSLVDGQYQLRMNNVKAVTAAQLVIQGPIRHGDSIPGTSLLGKNNVPGVANGNIARLKPGDSFGPTNFIEARYTDLAGSFGLWNDKDRGQAGVRFVQNGTVHYGFIDLTILNDNSIILHGFAYESTPSTPVTTFTIGTQDTSPWASILPFSANWKDTPFGLLDDSLFPWVYHAGFAQWLYVSSSNQPGTGFHLFPFVMKT